MTFLETKQHSETKTTFQVWIAKLLTSNGIPKLKWTSDYATWFTAGGAIRIAHYDVIDDVISWKL